MSTEHPTSLPFLLSLQQEFYLCIIYICVSICCCYGCAAHHSGQVYPGAIIRAVNGTDVSRMTLEEVVSAMKQAFSRAHVYSYKLYRGSPVYFL